MNLRIYVFAPYRDERPDIVVVNVLRAISVGEELSKAGYDDVFVPHLYHYWDQKFWHPHEFWMRKCLKEVKRSAVLVGAGITSEGCEEETREARVWGIPVYNTVKEFLDDFAVAKDAAKTMFGIGG